jgi:hypothetical protein
MATGGLSGRQGKLRVDRGAGNVLKSRIRISGSDRIGPAGKMPSY